MSGAEGAIVTLGNAMARPDRVWAGRRDIRFVVGVLCVAARVSVFVPACSVPGVTIQDNATRVPLGTGRQPDQGLGR